MRAAHLPTCVALFWFLPSMSFRLQGAHLAGTLSSSSPFHFSDSTLNGIVLFFLKVRFPVVEWQYQKCSRLLHIDLVSCDAAECIS